MVAARTPNVTRMPNPSRRTPAASGRSVRMSRPARTGWEAKLRPDMEPRVVEDRGRGGRLLLPTPSLIAEAVASIPEGHVLTIGQLRRQLASKFKADSTCPLMTGAFATILAGAVVEDLGQHRKPRWPIWRLVRDDGTLHPKWPLGPLYRATLLRQEGVRLTHRNGHWAAMDTDQS
jgi:alkylated DNA nucleotide flippase Atl1